MRHSIALAALLLSSAVFAQERWSAPASVPELSTRVTIVPFNLPPDMYMGEAAGVSTNSKGHIFVFTRTGHEGGAPARGGQAARLWEFEPNGKFVREIGKNLYGFSFAHGVRVDKDDNVWAIDEGTNMVIKFNPQGQVTLVLGRKAEAVDYLEHHLERAHPEGAVGSTIAREGGSPNQFNRPTDVTWDAAGNIYVSDGYNNARVAKYDKDGNWIRGWGTKGKEIGQFDTVHAIASDTAGNIYVGDRTNRRVQVFDGNGKFLRQFPNVGGGALCIPPGPNPNRVLFVAGNSNGGILKMNLDGRILGIVSRPGRSERNALPHAIACPTENELYVGETGTWRVKKITILQ